MFDGRFEVCGVIEMAPMTVRSRTVHVESASGELANTATAADDGTFCVYCKPGLYQFSVLKLLSVHNLLYCCCF